MRNHSLANQSGTGKVTINDVAINTDTQKPISKTFSEFSHHCFTLCWSGNNGCCEGDVRQPNTADVLESFKPLK